MQKKYKINNIVSKRTYTSEELALTIRVHIQTVRDWRRQGLKTIDDNSYPYLFLGTDIRNFLLRKINSFKVKLKGGEFYCLKCRKAVLPPTSRIVDRHILVGKNRHSVFLVGICPICGKQLKQFSTKEKEGEINSQFSAPETLKNKQEQITLFS